MDEYLRELNESQSRGRSSKLWAVRDGYEVIEGRVHGCGQQRFYYPMAYPRLPFELAKVANGGTEAVAGFVREWGLLGHSSLTEEASADEGEPVDFILGHAKTVDRLLRLHKTLNDPGADRSRLNYEFASRRTILDVMVDTQAKFFEVASRDPSPFATFLRDRIGEESFRDRIRADTEQSRRFNPDEQVWYWEYMEGTNPSWGALPTTVDIVQLALHIIASSISDNLNQVHPAIKAKPAVKTSVPTPDGPVAVDLGAPFALEIDWTALVQVAYWHLAIHVTGDRRIQQCEECGGFFEQTHARQRYCPPSTDQRTEVSTGMRSRAQSSCALRSRQRNRRQRSEHNTLDADT